MATSRFFSGPEKMAANGALMYVLPPPGGGIYTLSSGLCPWTEETCSQAVQGGHVEILQWAREHGCKWDQSCYLLASSHGRLALLKWARENGAPWNRDECLMAAQSGKHQHVVEWVLKSTRG